MVKAFMTELIRKRGYNFPKKTNYKTDTQILWVTKKA